MPVAKKLTPEKMLAMLPEWAHADPRIGELMKTAATPAAALEQYGIERFQAGDHDKAIKAFTAASVFAPGEAVYHNNLGVALNASGDAEGAISTFRASLKIDQNQPQIWLNLAHAAKPLGRYEEARDALLVAAKYTDTASEALTTLGNWQLEQGDYKTAAEILNRAIKLGDDNAAAHAALGASLFQLGAAGEAAAQYEEAARLQPAEQGYADNAAFLTMLDGVTRGEAEAALAAYAGPLSDDAILISAFNRALVFFTSFERRAAAEALLTEWLQYYPDDIDALYFRQIVTGKKLSRAPPEYIAKYFDRLAPQLDDKFLAAIEYRVPATMAEMLATVTGDGWRGNILDAGCGTGVLGRALKRSAAKLTGVDLSPRMVEASRAGLGYDTVLLGDLLPYLQGAGMRFDLIAAADSLVYFGALEFVFAAAQSALRPQGWFLFSVETLHDAGDYAVAPSGRFRHASTYVTSVGAKAFKLVQQRDVTLRLQAGKPIAGTIFLFQKL